ncbi:MAG: hypothetical protein IKU86_01955, partial [Thermoguttaceae bacterium]|nr:hypothetical protein [Thermoguttaceae bacterium]
MDRNDWDFGRDAEERGSGGFCRAAFWTAFLAALIWGAFSVAARGNEPPETLVSPSLPEPPERVEAPSRFELLAFLEPPGRNPACDAARPTLRRLGRDFRIETVRVETRSGREAVRNWDVKRFPTFVLVEKTSVGAGRLDGEIERGSGSFDLDRRIRDAFRRAEVRRPPKPLPPPRPEQRPA